LRCGLLCGGHWLGVRRLERVRGRLRLHAAQLRGTERGQLLRDHRGRVRRLARVRRDLHHPGLVVHKWPLQGRAGRQLCTKDLHHGGRRSVLR